MEKSLGKGKGDKELGVGKKKVEKFVDRDFPGNETSLAKDFSLIDESLRADWLGFGFKDIDRIYPQPIRVFDRISPNDILQGRLGNCYFLSALSALAEFPQRIMNCFDTQDYQESGKYTVKLFDSGIPITVTVDDYFPCTSEGKIAFSGPRTESGVTEIWVLILEKAWAKRFGSYWAIDKGAIEDVLRDLTGAPCENLLIEDSDLWHKVHSANKRNFIVTAARLSDENDDQEREVSEKGLVNFHAYAVIDVRKVRSRRGRERLVNIRNPWAKVEWNGDWADGSDLWTDELKGKLGWTNEDDGSFWMNFEDFCKNYHRVTICRVQDNYLYKGLTFTQDDERASVFSAKVSETGRLYFMVAFEDNRKSGIRTEYPAIRIIVTQKAPNGSLLRVSGQTTSNYRDSWVLIDADPGEYIIYLKISWTLTLTNKFGLSTYSSSPTDIKEVSSKYPDFLDQVYSADLGRSTGQKNEVKPGVFYYQTVFDGPSTEDICQFEGLYLDVFENLTDSEKTLQVTHQPFENLEVLGDFSQTSSYSIRLGPKEALKVIKHKKDFSKPALAQIQVS